MEFALTFGAVGDFVALVSLINDIRSAFDDCRGSSKTYRELLEGLATLEHSLQQVEKIYKGPEFATGLQDLRAIAQATVNQVCSALQEFRDKISSKYGPSLATGGLGNVLKDVTRTIQWKFEEKDIEQFRAKLAGLTVSLNLLLDVTTVRLMQQNQETTIRRIDETEKNTTSVIQQHGKSIEDTLKIFQSDKISKLDFLSGLGVDIKDLVSQTLTLMSTVSKDVNSLRAVLSRLERGVDNGKYVAFEDTTGHPLAMQLETTKSWEAFECMLDDGFTSIHGEGNVRRKLYSLPQSASDEDIDWSVMFGDASSPPLSSYVFESFVEDYRDDTKCSEIYQPKRSNRKGQQTGKIRPKSTKSQVEVPGLGSSFPRHRWDTLIYVSSAASITPIIPVKARFKVDDGLGPVISSALACELGYDATIPLNDGERPPRMIPGTYDISWTMGTVQVALHELHALTSGTPQILDFYIVDEVYADYDVLLPDYLIPRYRTT